MRKRTQCGGDRLQRCLLWALFQPSPTTVYHGETCVKILQYLTSVCGGSHGRDSQASTVSERGTRHLAMQAGLVAMKLTFRDVFTAVGNLFVFPAVLIGVRWRPQAPMSRCAAAA